MRRLETIALAVLFILACAVPAPALSDPGIPCMMPHEVMCWKPGNAELGVSKPGLLTDGAHGGGGTWFRADNFTEAEFGTHEGMFGAGT